MRIPTWLRVLLCCAVVLIWLVGAGVGGPTFGKLEEVSSNDQSSFLPASAESTVAAALLEDFRQSAAVPAVIVLESASPIEGQDMARYGELSRLLGAVHGLEPAGVNSPGVVGPIRSDDGLAIQYLAFVGEDAELPDVVADLRGVLNANLPAGATGYVTGPAGFTADLVDAFGGIDGILLAVAVGAVFVILLAVYRSIVLPLLVLLTSLCALATSILLIYALAGAGWIQLTGQSQGILSILVIGAATDYALLLVARFREGLGVTDSRWKAMRIAYRGSVAPISASAATVILGLLCLLFSDLNSNRSLGPIAAIGIGFALAAALSLLPALLLIFGRSAFWPVRPRVRGHRHIESPADGLAGTQELRGLWRRVAVLVGSRPRSVWAASLMILFAGALGLTQLQASGVPQSELILAPSNAVDGQDALGRHFDAGSGSPLTVVAPQAEQDAALALLLGQDSVSSAEAARSAGGEVMVRQGRVLIEATLEVQADSQAAETAVRELRSAFDAAGSSALVGGVSATAVDTNDTARADLFTIIPLVLLVILLVLIVLLRSIVAPVLLVLTVALSNATALGVSALVFNHVFGFAGADASVPLFAFVFLVALGVDYNIFLMTRVREEALVLGTRAGILRGLGATGGVITSAGVVLAATFAALGVIPILFLAQIAFVVAFGVLLDTVLVRSLLVPAIAYDLGPKLWWPSQLARSEARAG